MEEGETLSPASIEYALLGILDEKAMHGYELFRELSRKSGLGLIWTVKQAQLYALLAKLEVRGLVSAELVAEGPRPAKKVFHLTPDGRRDFAAWLRVPAERKNFRLDFLAKLICARKRNPGAAAELVSEQSRICGLWLAETRARESECPPGGLDRLVYRYRVGQLEAMIVWLAECADLAGEGA